MSDATQANSQHFASLRRNWAALPLRVKQFMLLLAALLAAGAPGVYWAFQAGGLLGKLKATAADQQTTQLRSYLLAVRSSWDAVVESSARIPQSADAPSELLNRAWSVINANRDDADQKLIYRELYIVRPDTLPATVPTSTAPPADDGAPPASLEGPGFNLNDILQERSRQRTAAQHAVSIEIRNKQVPVRVWQMGPDSAESANDTNENDDRVRLVAEYACRGGYQTVSPAGESRALVGVPLRPAAQDDSSSPLGDGWLIAEYNTLAGPVSDDSVMLPAILTLLLSLAVASLLGIVLQRVVVEPVQSLSGAMAQVADEGNYTLRVPETRHDELGQLQIGFNQMIARVEELTAGLEARVHDRTKELDRANRELQRSNTDLDRFAYTVSHDLQAPLRNVTLIVQQLREDWDGRVSNEVMQRIEEIDRQCDREMKMVQRILFISRLGRGEFQQQPVDMNATLTQILEGMRASLQDRGVIVDVPAPLPTVAGDSILLGEVLRNLLSNAAKYNDKPEKRIRVRGRIYPQHGMTLFAVEDNGIGIRPQHLKKVFDLFTPLHDKRKFSETIGAGMAITKRIVERHRGKIRVVSVYGSGTSFFFRLPTEGIVKKETNGTDSHRTGSVTFRTITARQR